MDADGPSKLTFRVFLRRCIAVVLVGAVGATLVYFPYAQIALTLGLCLYGAVLYVYPNAWLIVIPALSPVLDLAPWSGWFFLDELDLFVLMTLAIGLWRPSRNAASSSNAPRFLFLALGMLSISYTVSMLIGLLPLQPWDANAFSNYYSHYNSLRMGKGFFEAVALFLLFSSQPSDEGQKLQGFVAGMVLGLMGVVAAVLWERFVFTGIFDFASVFRVTATFSGMHNGGNDLEAYVVLAQPFVVALIVLRKSPAVTLGGLALFVLSTYASLITFSRSAILALIVNWTLLALCVVISRWHQLKHRMGQSVLVGLFLGATTMVVVLPILSGPFFKGRLAMAGNDWEYRLLQSIKTIEMMSDDRQTTWFGMGLGRYPEEVYLKKPLTIKPATYHFESDANNLFLRLTPGSPIYYGQWIKINAQTKYQLSLRVRAKTRGALSVYICEKTLQYSFRCATQRFEVNPSDSWDERRAEIDVGLVGAEIGPSGWSLRRPVEFALANSSKDADIDLDNVRLLDGAGRNLISNGDYSNGSDRWFFTADDHTPWQNWNHLVQLYFDQGWFGIISFLIFTAYILGVLVRRVVKGDWVAGVTLAGLSSFLSVGIFGFMFDTPRMALNFFLIALIFASRSMMGGADRPARPADQNTL